MDSSVHIMPEPGYPVPETPWYAVRVKSNFEKITALNIRAQGYEEFLPAYTCLRRWASRTRVVELPLFPGYVFSRFGPNDRMSILKIPGVVHIVGIGRVLAPVDPAELAAIKAILRSKLSVEPWGFLRPGQRVFLEEGPLRGMEGVIVQVGKTYRLIVSVTLLQRSVAVDIDGSWVRPIHDMNLHSGRGVQGPELLGT